MTIAVDFSTDLDEWIRLAGLDTIQGSKASDGRTAIWNKGGEARYLVSFIDGYYVITSSTRLGPENFHIGTATMALLEKYLFGHFGNSVRRRRGLNWVRKPFAMDELQKRYAIGKIVFLGRERDALIDEAEAVLSIGAVDRLVELSHYINVPVSVIRDSFLNPEGKPLFSPLEGR
ncbi:hypothetical protein F0Q45_19245 [Mycobacterium simiae]|uniref:Immunity factor for TNT n=1 Tax=Mycobacterium simiae TaxID=1784 RepID=A0A5B1BJ29_MYCSI|nr:Imm61 family immunity protein [Mycobacterium simiae]KAA1248678.1 hypothetical protein F0Q45_19245 [Mycobacterium simiae]